MDYVLGNEIETFIIHLPGNDDANKVELKCSEYLGICK